MRVVCEPVRYRDEYAVGVEKEIADYFQEVIFTPLEDLLADPQKLNEDQSSALLTAIAAGLVWYNDGVFRGSFHAAISRELRSLGAQKVADGFALPLVKMPLALRSAITQSKAHAEAAHNRIAETLLTMGALAAAAVTGIQIANTVDKMLGDLQKQFTEAVSKVSGLPNPPETPQELKEEIRGRIAEGVELAIKNFTPEATQELRAKALQNLREGARMDRLVAIIQAERGVALRKARFIAENETSIAAAHFRQERFESVGSSQYVWRTMGDAKVRPTHGESNNHRVLEGRTFYWASPPVVDPATGRRRNPGEDYNCRCDALPVLELK